MDEFAMLDEMDRAGLIKEVNAVAAEIEEHEREIKTKSAWVRACRERLASM